MSIDNKCNNCGHQKRTDQKVPYCTLYNGFKPLCPYLGTPEDKIHITKQTGLTHDSRRYYPKCHKTEK